MAKLGPAKDRVTVLGTYRVKCTPELLAQAMEFKWPHLTDKKELKQAAIWTKREIESAVLIELDVPPPNAEFDIGEISQEGSDQAAYDEHYLSNDGTKVISDFRAPTDRPWSRVAFFLHFFEESKPLRTSFGSVMCPKPAPMPKRLAKLMPYEPVD